MRTNRQRVVSILASMVVVAPLGARLLGEEPEFSAEQIEFFERSVRPVLVRRCHGCHGAEKSKSGLRLDSRQGVLAGGEGGLVVLAGKPAQSRLVRAIGYDGDLQMPPDGKLPAAEIEALTAWVRMGLPWGGDSAPTAERSFQEFIRSARETHWAFRPVRRPAVPAVRDRDWPRNAGDRFVLARLEAREMRPAAPADRRTLIRRLYLDLLGVPPTPESVASFENDPGPDAYARLLDRLLASPRYGERWGRHWLDVARYADTKGYVFTAERRFPYSYTYRDYVIRSFNEDRPYDRFVREQLAADQVDLEGDDRALAAMGFLTLGRRFLNNQHDIIDDRIDVVTRGLMGLTVGCARCHDHKYDPVPSRDYYSLYGVFASSQEPDELPQIGQADDSPEYAAFAAELEKLEREVEEYVDSKHHELREHLRDHAADYLLAAARESKRDRPGFLIELKTKTFRDKCLARWKAFLERTRAEHHPVLAPWHAFAALEDERFAEESVAVAEQVAAGATAAGPIGPVNAAVAAAFERPAPATLRDVALSYRDLFARVESEWKARQAAGADGLRDAALEEVRQVLHGAGTPADISRDDVRELFNRADRNQHRELRRKVDRLRATHPGAPARAMTLVDAPTPVDPYVFERGNPRRRGESVPRQFLAVLSSEDRRPFERGSGRLELAEAIARPDNPLTARVFVNRVWAHHFGEGLVRTPADFGFRGEPPTHPGLLDYLASRFVDEGWSVKKLHRWILDSSTYRQSGSNDLEYAELDVDNRAIWRLPSRRLDFEAQRDSLLAVADRLSTRMGGRAVDILSEPFSLRRTVYGFIDRQNLPGVLRTFDFASPDATSPGRHETTVPQQALYMMNSPFVLEQAKHVAARPDVVSCADAAARIRRLYWILYGRAPRAEEVELGRRFIAARSDEGAAAWTKYAQVLLMANEFVYVD